MTRVPQKIGYARTKPDQDDLQHSVLELLELGVESALVFTHRGSSARGKDRTELPAAITTGQPGDVMVVASLARLARSHHDLAAFIDTLQNHQITLKVAGQDLKHITGAAMVAMSAQLRADLITEVIAEHHQYKTRRRDTRGAKPALPPMGWLTSRDHNRLKPTQAQTVIVAALLHQLWAITTTGKAGNPVVAANGLARVKEANVA